MQNYSEVTYKRLRWDGCFYCGMPANTLDHFPPRSVANTYPPEYPRVKVDCCFECNTLLGNSIQDSLEERREVVVAKLRRRYRKIINMPDWSEEELSEVSELLADDIRRSLAERERQRARVGL